MHIVLFVQDSDSGAYRFGSCFLLASVLYVYQVCDVLPHTKENKTSTKQLQRGASYVHLTGGVFFPGGFDDVLHQEETSYLSHCAADVVLDTICSPKLQVCPSPFSHRRKIPVLRNSSRVAICTDRVICFCRNSFQTVFHLIAALFASWVIRYRKARDKPPGYDV